MRLIQVVGVHQLEKCISRRTFERNWFSTRKQRKKATRNKATRNKATRNKERRNKGTSRERTWFSTRWKTTERSEVMTTGPLMDRRSSFKSPD